MITLRNTTLFVLAVALLIVASLYLIKPFTSFGSVSQASEYLATTTSAIADGHHAIAGNKIVTLGSVVMTNPSSATSTVIWNATSTTDVSSSTFATIPAGATAGTYTFDAILDRGLVVDTGVGNTGEAVITFRP